MMKSRQTSNIKNQILLATVILVVSLLSWRFFPTPIQSISDLVFKPLLQTESVIYKKISRDAEVQGITAQEELDYLRAENASLREHFSENNEGLIIAGVIGRPTALPYDVLLIDRGKDDGILENTPVYAGKDKVIGYVISVYQKSAVVALITTPGFTSTVFVYGPNIYTTAEGLGGGVIRIHIPQGINISTGDPVVVPSLSAGIYGSITAIDSVPSRPEQYGYVTSDTPINSLRYVSVGNRPLSTMSFEEARTVVDNTRRDFLSVPVPDGVLIEVEDATSTSTPETNSEESSNTPDEATSTEEIIE